VNVTSHGDITATGDTTVKGIYAVNAGAGTINVKNYGGTNGVRTSGIGLFGKSTTGAVQIYSTGKITSTNNQQRHRRAGHHRQRDHQQQELHPVRHQYLRHADGHDDEHRHRGAHDRNRRHRCGQHNEQCQHHRVRPGHPGPHNRHHHFGQRPVAVALVAAGRTAITISSTGDITSVSTTAYATITGGLTSAGATMAATTAMASNGAAAVNVTSVGNLSSQTLGI
jgi:hypothetical protein